jgi:hypothetical protein
LAAGDTHELSTISATKFSNFELIEFITMITIHRRRALEISPIISDPYSFTSNLR